jgi:FkbM family methyltransferase
VQANHIIPRFQALGHHVDIFAWYGLQGGRLNMGDSTIYPVGLDPYGNDIVEAHAKHAKADVVISLMDAWVLRDHGKKKMRWIPYMPVDQDPVPAAVLEAIKGAYRVASYSRWGEKLLNEAGVENTYIPHGVDTTVFAPGDKAEARKKMGIDEDAFVIGMVAANKGYPARKAFPENLAAVSLFKKAHPTAKVRLYMHTLETTGFGGVDFNALLQSLDFQKEEVVFCNQYAYINGMPESYMAMAYNAMDVLLAASMSEGFGIPLIEAQACGTPVITTDFSSMPELVFSGYKAQWCQKFWTPLNSWIVVPSIQSIEAGLRWAYTHRGRANVAEKAREGALAYEWDTIVERYWKPFLAEIEAEITAGHIAGPHTHDWYPTGLYNSEGAICVPCRHCDDELVAAKDGTRTVVKDGFALKVDGKPLDIEDDPKGGVAKVVGREVQKAYGGDTIPLQAGDVVVDVGAQVGVVSCYLAKKHPGIKVLAYEPMPENFARLERNIKANGVEAEVTAFNLAVTGDGRDLRLLANPAMNSGGASAFVGEGQVTVTSKSVTLAQVFEAVGAERIKLLKIDCEGAEYEIIGDGALLSRVDYLSGEFHMNKRLTEAGYSFEKLTEVCKAHIPEDHLHITLQVIT